MLADEQSAGRGRSGRPWLSPPGAGIWLALVLRPAAVPLGGALSIRTGLAVQDALGVAAPLLRPDLKWPNDVVLNGKKIGGILCEAHWSSNRLGWVAVGIGLNVLGPIPAELQDLALPIVDVDPDATRLGILAELVPRVAALAGCPAALTDQERAGFLSTLWMPPGSEPVVGLEPDGALLVRRADGTLDRRTDAT